METRINLFEKGQKAMGSLYGVGIYLKKSSIEQALLDLVYFRVSQINGCAFCLDMHAKDLLLKGESQQRLFVLDAWREIGVPPAEAAQRTSLLRHFIVGFCVETQTLAQFRVNGQLDELAASVDPARFPLAAQALPILLGTTDDDHFELGIRLMLT